MVRSAPHPRVPAPPKGTLHPPPAVQRYVSLQGAPVEGAAWLSVVAAILTSKQGWRRWGHGGTHPGSVGMGEGGGHGDMITEKGASEVTKATASWITGLTICLHLCNQHDRHPQWVSGGG